MANTQTTICIKALDIIGEKSITAITDNNPRAQALNREYESTLREVLAAAPWQFAKKPIVLTPNVSAPLFRWKTAFTLPADFISVVMFNGSHVWAVTSGLFDLSDGSIVTNASACNLEYVYYNVDTSKYHPLFCTALSTLLAARVAAAVREDGAELSMQLENVYYQRALPRARLANAQQSRRRRYDIASESRFVASRRISTNG